MSFKEKFMKKKALLSRQQKKQIQNKDLRGSFPTVVQKELLPHGIGLWKCTSEDHHIDIIPFFAGKNFPIDPKDGTKLVEEGDPVYVLDLAIHRNIGPMKLPYVCPLENYGLPCPVCEFIGDNRLEKDDWKKVKTKRTTFYLIWCHDTREEEKKGLQLWEVAHFVFEEKLNVISKLPKGGGIIEFADPYEGRSILFTKEGKGMNIQYLGHRLIDRDMPIPEKLLEMSFPIDSVIKHSPTYEEMEQAFMGQKSKLSTEEDVNSSGNTFGGGKETMGDDVPAWMTSSESDSEPETKQEVKTKPKILLRKLILKK